MTVTAAEFHANFSKYLDLLLGEDILITQNGKAVAKLVKPTESAVDAISGLLAGKLPDGFNAKSPQGKVDAEHSDYILKIMEERNITAYQMAKGTGITNSLFSLWKKKPTSKIFSGNLVLIADFLDCSVDYLLGRTDDPTPPRRPAQPTPNETE